MLHLILSVTLLKISVLLDYSLKALLNNFHMVLIILNSFFCLAFAAFAYVNLNDPDAWLWVSIYMVASVCCGLAVFQKYFPIVYLVAIGFLSSICYSPFFYKRWCERLDRKI